MDVCHRCRRPNRRCLCINRHTVYQYNGLLPSVSYDNETRQTQRQNPSLVSACLLPPHTLTSPTTVAGYSTHKMERHNDRIERPREHTVEGIRMAVVVYKMQPSTRYRNRQPGINFALHEQQHHTYPIRLVPGPSVHVRLSGLTRLLHPCQSKPRIPIASVHERQ